MERGVVRAVAVVALVLLLAGDLTSVFAPMLQMMGVVSETAPGGQVASGVEEGADYEKKDAIDMLSSSPITKSSLLATIRNSCLPKLICELNATPHRERLSDSEKSLLSLIRDTSIGTTAEVTSKYHFAAHMGQLIAGVEGAGCHNFYPGCPFPGLQVLQMMKKVKIR